MNSAKNTKAQSPQKTPSKSTEVKADNSTVELQSEVTALKTALATEKDLHQKAVGDLATEKTNVITANNKLKSEVDEHSKTKQALTDTEAVVKEAKNTVNSANQRIKELEENNFALVPGTVVETIEEEGCTLEEALEFVSVQVPTLKEGKPELDSKGDPKTHLAKVEAHEALSFKDHGDHVIVITKSGNRIRGSK